MKDKTFNAAASGKTDPARLSPSQPKPEKLLAKGITTNETLAWEEKNPPPVLAPEPTPDDPGGWRTALEKAEKSRAKVLEQKKQDFLARFGKAREDFRTARDYRGEPPRSER